MTIRARLGFIVLLILTSVPFASSASKPPKPEKVRKEKPPPPPLDSLDLLARQIQAALKNNPVGSLAIMEFYYLDGHQSAGTALVQKELIATLQKRGIPVAEKVDVDSAARSLELEPSISKPEIASQVAWKLGVPAFAVGELNDLKGKNKTDVHVILYESLNRRILGAGAQTIEKTWKDPVTECGKMNYQTLAPGEPQGTYAPEAVQFAFVPSWGESSTLGKTSWNFCRKDGKTPNLNDALSDLKRKTWDAGGQKLLIHKNDRDAENPKVLKIEADVIK